jgi:hypothetical protein
MVVYARIIENISVRGCQDPAFNLLAAALRRWFPLDPQSNVRSLGKVRVTNLLDWLLEVI